MFKHRRSLSQNFLYNHQLVKYLVGLSSIGKQDLVFEIGAGKGVITRELCQRAKKVVAIEIDARLDTYLKKNITENNFRLIHGNILDFNFPSVDYKIFSNLPFSIEGKIIRKILTAKYPALEACLIVRKRPALRWTGHHKNSLFYCMFSPWFDFKIVYSFKSSDFQPAPKVTPAMIRIRRKGQYLVTHELRYQYWQFLERCFKDGRKMKYALRPFFSKSNGQKICSQLHISQKKYPTQISVDVWIELFREIYKKYENLTILVIFGLKFYQLTYL